MFEEAASDERDAATVTIEQLLKRAFIARTDARHKLAIRRLGGSRRN